MGSVGGVIATQNSLFAQLPAAVHTGLHPRSVDASASVENDTHVKPFAHVSQPATSVGELIRTAALLQRISQKL